MTVSVAHLPRTKQQRALLVETFLMWCQDEGIVLAELDGDKTFPLSLEAQGEELLRWAETSED